jgi:hypothetical protein
MFPKPGTYTVLGSAREPLKNSEPAGPAANEWTPLSLTVRCAALAVTADDVIAASAAKPIAMIVDLLLIVFSWFAVGHDVPYVDETQGRRNFFP